MEDVLFQNVRCSYNKILMEQYLINVHYFTFPHRKYVVKRIKLKTSTNEIFEKKEHFYGLEFEAGAEK